MQFKNFKNGRNFTIGAELELRILNEKDYSFANEYEYFKKNISLKYKKYITPELLQSMLEINTPVFEEHHELVGFLRGALYRLNKLARKKYLLLHTSGTNTLKQKNVKMVKNERYRKICKTYGVLMDDFYICGTHIHVGFKDFQKALNAYNFAIKYLPMLVALSASSPFFSGKNTGMHSYRTKIFDRLSRASIPQYFDSFEDMKACYDLLFKTNVIQSQKDIWWDIRIQDKLKTVEFRVLDGINDLERLEVLIGLVRGICILAQSEKPDKMLAQILKENMWNATRYSMGGDFIHDEKRQSIKDAILDLLKKLHVKNIIDEKFLQKALKVANEPSIAQKMLKKYEKTKDLKEVEKMGIIK